MKEFSSVTKKVIKALRNGRKLTSAKMRDMGVANPSATVYHLRNRYDMRIEHDGSGYRLT